MCKVAQMIDVQQIKGVKLLIDKYRIGKHVAGNSVNESGSVSRKEWYEKEVSKAGCTTGHCVVLEPEDHNLKQIYCIYKEEKIINKKTKQIMLGMGTRDGL